MASHEPWRRALSALPPVQLLRPLWLLLLLLNLLRLSGAHASAIDPVALVQQLRPTNTTADTVGPTEPPTTASAVRSVAAPLPPPTVHAAAADDRDDRDDADDDDDNRIRESVVISTAVDAEREAQDLYDKALRQYDAYGASARNTCATWEMRGCQCTVAEKLTLTCRNVGLEEVPLDLPAEIVKL